MNRLQENFYIAVPTECLKYYPILMNLLSYSRFLENARFVRELQLQQPEYTEGYEIANYIKLRDSFILKTRKLEPNFREEFEAALPWLNRLSTGEPKPFWKKSNPVKERIYLPTEKFFWKYPTTNIGSGRHSLLYDMQVKGNGRNALAIRTDFSHAWGGSFIWQSLKSYAITTLLKGMLPQGIMGVEMVSVFDDDKDGQKINPSARALQFREAKGLRVTQVCTSMNPNQHPNQKEILTGLLKKQKLKNSSQLLEKSLFTYASMFMNGLKHLSVTKENITLEGQLLDYEDVEYLTDKENYHLQIYLKIPLNRGQKPPESPKLLDKEFLPYLKKARLYTTTLHHALYAGYYTHVGLSYLDPKLKLTNVQRNKRIMKLVKDLSEDIFDITKDFKSFTNDLSKLTPAYYTNDLTGRSGDLILDFLKKYKNLDYSTVMNKNEPTLMTLTIQVKLPRPKLKNNFLESFNQEKHNVTFESQISMMLKYLHLESHSTEFDFKNALNYTSICHSFLSKNAKIFPYEISKGSIKEISQSKRSLLKELESKIVIKNGLKISKIEYSLMVNDEMTQLFSNLGDFKKIKTALIIHGLEVLLPDGEPHFLPYGPLYIKPNNKEAPHKSYY